MPYTGLFGKKARTLASPARGRTMNWHSSPMPMPYGLLNRCLNSPQSTCEASPKIRTNRMMFPIAAIAGFAMAVVLSRYLSTTKFDKINNAMRAPGHRIGSHAEPDRQRPGTNYPVDTLSRLSIPMAISSPRARRPFPLDRATFRSTARLCLTVRARKDL